MSSDQFYAYHAPSITSITPDHRFVGAFDEIFAVTLVGSDFGVSSDSIDELAVGGSSRSFSFVDWTSTSMVSTSYISLFDALAGTVVGAGNTTTVDVRIRVGGQTDILATGFTILGAPVITSISPSIVIPGTTLSIRGGPFGYVNADLRNITVGGVPCTQFFVLSLTTATCVVPSGEGLGVEVVVTNAGLRSSEVTSESRVSYSVGQAVFTSLSPTHGATQGA